MKSNAASVALYRENEQEWLAKNPLKIWRTKNRLIQGDIAALVGVNYHTVYRWERGMAVPSEEQMIALSSVTGLKSIASLWTAWTQKRPTMGINNKGGKSGR